MSLYDKIAASAPINKTAALSTARGSEWTPATRRTDWYPEPLPLQTVDERRSKARNPEFVDFTGVEIGRLVVIGLVDKGEMNGKRPSSWLCKCKCGCYCTRTSKSLRVGLAGGNSFIPMCGRCDYQGKLARGWTPNLKNKPVIRP